MRIIGLDMGTRTIGVAVSDSLGMTAQPVKTIKRTGLASDLKELSALIAEFEITEIVLGLPIRLDGTKSPMSEAVEVFAGKLGSHTGLPVKLWDERLSTAAVTRVLKDADMSRAKRKKVVDKLAACYILQGYLDSRGSYG
ncbi:MAG: Holliday junction resolvase RuvX [Proteobacteria bacterium]|nr:Holliday junction resolvase RuvX [Pseudomonadota bacterium]